MAEQGKVKLHNIEINNIVVTVKGSTPLICDRFSEKAKGQIEGKQQKKGDMGKGARDPEAEFKNALYVKDDGNYGFPAIAFKKAMVRAAKFTDDAMTDMRGAFHVIGDLLPIRSEDEPSMRSDRVNIGRGTTSIAYRAQFKDWEMDIPIRYNAKFISAEKIINLLQLAGFAVGVGAWRPQNDGQFGMFEVKVE